MSLAGSHPDPFGDPLSPAAMADFRRQLILKRYLPKNGGLFGNGWAQFMASQLAPPPAPVTFPDEGSSAVDPDITYPVTDTYQVAAQSRGGWPIPLPGCANCHGPSQPGPPPTAPPRPPVADDPWTYYPDISQRDGGGWGRSPSNSGDDRKQCEIQLGNDGRICSRQADDGVKAECRASATRRYSHCRDTGEVGVPALSTAKHLDGEPPIRRWRKPR